MTAASGILYVRSQNGTALPSDGEIERLIEDKYPGVLASIVLKEH